MFFSDAVFAIVITLLVLPLTAELDLPESPAALTRALWSLWPKVVSFVLSFVIVGQFWVAHHRLSEGVRRYDLRLLWLNLLSLLTVTFLPFPTALVGAHHDQRVVVVLYTASLLLASLTLGLVWLYAWRVGRLLREDLDRGRSLELTVRALATPAMFLIGVVVALVGSYLAVAAWLLLIHVLRAALLRLAGRHIR